MKKLIQAACIVFGAVLLVKLLTHQGHGKKHASFELFDRDEKKHRGFDPRIEVRL